MISWYSSEVPRQFNKVVAISSTNGTGITEYLIGFERKTGPSHTVQKILNQDRLAA